MHITSGYVLREINNNHYILPVGQRIANHKRGVHINNTGVLIWDILQTDHSKDELIEELCKKYSCDKNTHQAIENDVTLFITQLSSLGILTTDYNIPQPSHYFNIADINISYSGEDTFIHQSLLDFTCSLETVDLIHQNWVVIKEDTNYNYNGTLLIHSEQAQIYVSDSQYIFYFPMNKYAKKCTISFDGKDVLIYCSSYGDDTKRADEVFHIMRMGFIRIAQLHGLFAIHSASILYNNNAWVFSASSGTGKSTHTNMWKELYNTPIINGDLNLIGIENGKPMVYGIPWCGTSGKYSTGKHQLGGIVLLGKSNTDIIEKLTIDEQIIAINQRLISPNWTVELFDINLEFCQSLINHINVCRFTCTKETSAVDTIKKYIDEDN